MPETTLEERLDAVERALTGERSVPDSDEPGTIRDDPGRSSDEFERLEARVEAVEDAVDELQAALQAVRGYVGSVKHVNDEVADRADVALAKAEAVERTLETKITATQEDAGPTLRDRHPRQPETDTPPQQESGFASGHETGPSSEHEPSHSDDEPPDQVNDPNRNEDRSVGHRPVEDSWLTEAQSATNSPVTGDSSIVDCDGESGLEGESGHSPDDGSGPGHNGSPDDSSEPAEARSLLDRLRRGL